MRPTDDVTLNQLPPINYQEVIARASLVMREGSKQEKAAVIQFVDHLYAIVVGVGGDYDDAST